MNEKLGFIFDIKSSISRYQNITVFPTESEPSKGHMYKVNCTNFWYQEIAFSDIDKPVEFIYHESN